MSKCINCGLEFIPDTLTEIWNNSFCTDRCRTTFEKVPDTEFDRQFNEAKAKAEASIPHPLLNPDSTHYQMCDGVEAITRMEQMYSTKELMIWAKITAMKYRLRIGNKDEIARENTKIKGYEAYYKYLKNKWGARFEK